MIDPTRGDWCLTFTGRVFYPWDPRPEDFCIEDIAHHLSHVSCRYGGACRRFYSVAEHSVLISCLAPDPWKLEALLHDVGEMISGDLVQQIKHARGMTAFRRLDKRTTAAAFKWAGVKPTRASTAAIKELDNRIVRDEIRALLKGWEIYIKHRPGIAELRPTGALVVGLQPERAEQLFLARFESLTRERNRPSAAGVR